jgi:hypothetical protein
MHEQLHIATQSDLFDCHDSSLMSAATGLTEPDEENTSPFWRPSSRRPSYVR